MAFDEVRLSLELEYGATGGSKYMTTIHKSKSGYEQRVAAQDQPLGEWRVGYGLKGDDDRAALIDFFHARSGRFRGFRFRDWSDYKHDMTTSPARISMLPATGDGANDTFQLVKAYTSGAITKNRTIFKPVKVGSDINFAAYVNGVLQTDTTHYILTEATGAVVFQPGFIPPAAQPVEWEGEFDVPTRLDDDLLQIELEFHQLTNWRGIRIVELRDIT